MLKKRNEDTMFIDVAIQRSIFIPIGLGSKCFSLRFKVRGLLHALLIQYGAAMFGKSRAEAVAVTADLGTEIGVPEFQCKSCCNCLPPWQRAELGADDDQADPLESEQPVFGSAMAVAGLLRVCHNLYLECDESMVYWVLWLPFLNISSSSPSTSRIIFMQQILTSLHFER